MDTQEIRDIDAKTLWKKVLGELQIEKSEFVYKTWISRATAQNLTENTIDLICPSRHVKEQLSTKYVTFVKETIDRMAKSDIRINFVI